MDIKYISMLELWKKCVKQNFQIENSKTFRIVKKQNGK
jgi:hypothetical protein